MTTMYYEKFSQVKFLWKANSSIAIHQVQCNRCSQLRLLSSCVVLWLWVHSIVTCRLVSQAYTGLGTNSSRLNPPKKGENGLLVTAFTGCVSWSELSIELYTHVAMSHKFSRVNFSWVLLKCRNYTP